MVRVCARQCLTRVTRVPGMVNLMSKPRPHFLKRLLKPDDACFVTQPLLIAAFDWETKFSWLTDDIIKLLCQYLLAATYPKVRNAWSKFPRDKSTLSYASNSFAYVHLFPMPKGCGMLRYMRERSFVQLIAYVGGSFTDFINPICVQDFAEGPDALPKYRAHKIEFFTLGSGERAMFIVVDPEHAELTMTRLNGILRTTADYIHDFGTRVRIELCPTSQELGPDKRMLLRPPCVMVAIRQCSLHFWSYKKCCKHSRILETDRKKQCEDMWMLQNAMFNAKFY